MPFEFELEFGSGVEVARVGLPKSSVSKQNPIKAGKIDSSSIGSGISLTYRFTNPVRLWIGSDDIERESP